MSGKPGDSQGTSIRGGVVFDENQYEDSPSTSLGDRGKCDSPDAGMGGGGGLCDLAD